ncbi:hypothetical protein EYC80_006943 [Monilinia laxa]|uniref:Uncharacterized protein n=1 Tax=Monilinia laxa TaxID=61186 RepID=A0A5N6JZM5_MONLA|nr:hypothetical protein EYC80_006943 [Monilinia laxa]
MSAELLPPEPITLSNFNHHPRFPPECRLAIYHHLLSRTILEACPPILFALHGTPIYKMLQEDYRKSNFFLARRTLPAYARLAHHDGSLDKIHYLHIRGNRALYPNSRLFPSVLIYLCFFQGHASITSNSFHEINIELKLSRRSFYEDILQTIYQMAKASTAASTTVPYQFVRSDADLVRDYCWRMDDAVRDARGKRWKRGRRELRGVDGVLYGKREVIWVWVAGRVPREMQFKVKGWHGSGTMVTRAWDVLRWLWICFVE